MIKQISSDLRIREAVRGHIFRGSYTGAALLRHTLSRLQLAVCRELRGQVGQGTARASRICIYVLTSGNDTNKDL